MTRSTRRHFLTASLCALGTAALAEAPLRAPRPASRSLGEAPAPIPGKSPVARPTMQDLIAEAALGGQVGFALADVESGHVHDSEGVETALPPASTLKSITALYALDRLGPDYRFSTLVLGTAQVGEGGVLAGDLILAGGGDPVLDTNQLADLAAALADSGLRRVTGRFLVHGGALPYVKEIEPGQLDHLGYNPAVSGLNLNYNRVHFSWERDGDEYRVLMDARSDLYRPEVGVARMRVVDRALPVYTYEDGSGWDQWTVARAQLGSAGSRWLPVRRPALYAADVFRTLLAAKGIALAPAVEIDAVPTGSIELARHMSGPLREIAESMLRWSTNLTAEVLGMSASVAAGPLQSHADSAAQMTRWFAETFAAGPAFVDHSGLSDASRISPGQMATMLARAHGDARLKPLLKHIPLIDGSGAPLQFARGDVVAKTGTLNFVSALAGYITTLEGKDLAFAIFCANEERRAAAAGSQDELPEGASWYNGRAKRLQQRMLQRWGLVGAAEDDVTAEATLIRPDDDATPPPGGIAPALFRN